MTARRRMGSRRSRSGRGGSHRRDRKDRLLQTRVGRELEHALKEEAGKRRLSVSHLIRNVLEDALDIVDDVVAGVDDIVSDSMGMAFSVQKDAQKLAKRAVRSFDSVLEARGARARPEPEAPGAPPSSDAAPDEKLAHVDAWNRVTLNKDVVCTRCGAAVPRGIEAHLGVSSDPTKPTAWLCGRCLAAL